MSHATKEQQNLIESSEGYIRCGAVPGSGKTFCITNRIAFLIQELYVDPSSIVALTFTNKAAASMKERLKGIIGDEADNPLLDFLKIGHCLRHTENEPVYPDRVKSHRCRRRDKALFRRHGKRHANRMTAA